MSAAAGTAFKAEFPTPGHGPPIVTSPGEVYGAKVEDRASAPANRRRAAPSQGPDLGDDIAAFVNKLSNMVNDPSCNDLISWTPSGTSFCVYKPTQFAKDVLPKFFKHNNFSSFVRQLNMYGFHKVVGVEQGSLNSDDDTQEFINPNFVRDRPELMKEVKRKVAADDKAKAAFTGDIKRVVEELELIKSQQAAITDKLESIDKNNQTLWNGMLALRQRHQRQEQTIRKILQFLASVYSAERKTLSDAVPTGQAKRRRLMIEAAPQSPTALPDVPLDGYAAQSTQAFSPLPFDSIAGASFNAGGTSVAPVISTSPQYQTPTYSQIQAAGPAAAGQVEASTGIPVASTMSVVADIDNVQRDIDAFQQSLLDGSYGFDLSDLATLSVPAVPAVPIVPQSASQFPVPLSVDLLEELSRLGGGSASLNSSVSAGNLGTNLVEYRQDSSGVEEDELADGTAVDSAFGF